MFTSDEPIA